MFNYNGGVCAGMADSKEFAVGIFDALVRRRRQKTVKINKAELHEFWLQISDQSFDARLQIFFDMCVCLSHLLYFSVSTCLLLPQFLLVCKRAFGLPYEIFIVLFCQIN